MLHITIKDNNTNEVIYDGQVSMVILNATEKDGVRTIRHKTEDASIGDVIKCVKSVVQEAAEVKQLLSEAFIQAIDEINIDDLAE